MKYPRAGALQDIPLGIGFNRAGEPRPAFQSRKAPTENESLKITIKVSTFLRLSCNP